MASSWSYQPDFVDYSNQIPWTPQDVRATGDGELLYSPFGLLVLLFACNVLAGKLNDHKPDNPTGTALLDEEEPKKIYVPKNNSCQVFIKKSNHGTEMEVYNVMEVLIYDITGHEMYKEVLKEACPRLLPRLRHSEYVTRVLGIGYPNVDNIASFRYDIITKPGLMSLADLQERYLNAGAKGVEMEEKTSLCADICRGLHALHEAGLSHGDINSENVFVFSPISPSRLFHATVGDFGLCALTLSSNNEKVDDIGGTAPWHAPELLEYIVNRRRSHQFSLKDVRNMDYYSLGLLIWRVLMEGRYPFSLPPVKSILSAGVSLEEKALWDGEKEENAIWDLKEDLSRFANAVKKTTTSSTHLVMEAVYQLCVPDPSARSFHRSRRILGIDDLDAIDITPAGDFFRSELAKTYTIFWPDDKELKQFLERGIAGMLVRTSGLGLSDSPSAVTLVVELGLVQSAEECKSAWDAIGRGTIERTTTLRILFDTPSGQPNDINEELPSGFTLTCACAVGEMEIALALLSLGADPRKSNKFNAYPIHYFGHFRDASKTQLRDLFERLVKGRTELPNRSSDTPVVHLGVPYIPILVSVSAGNYSATEIILDLYISDLEQLEAAQNCAAMGHCHKILALITRKWKERKKSTPEDRRRLLRNAFIPGA
ncbi:kinase-like protein [Lentithecium fluviatile CBS 122367]|uniref:Kinase-like protein n=1 Tax=Lentithecium fluviatile CBS 122367 TaxID=1168545 RepID=A0A6G1IDQ7_9PLEO|nr:kinase-like protein [Lentithecium fluviatile CBS 122367]